MDSSKQQNAPINIGQVELREITQEVKESYIDYAMSVIVSRALPDVRDGLKPVHRRILYAMLEDGLRSNAKFRKSALVIGSVLSRYHPHGDMAVYDALTRMAQDFSLRYPLVEGQGNFGSIDGDAPAAYRYTEARLSQIGEILLQDIEKDTVDFMDNYDGTRKEPKVLPSPLPQLLINGTLGIAVGMATNIPPHNLGEVVDAAVYLIDHPKAQTADLLQFIKGPDFPTGGIIFAGPDLNTIYTQGKGTIVLRGKAEIVESKKGAFDIIITEIPYQVQKSSLLEKFAQLVESKQLEGIKDIRDESDKEGLRIVLELKSNAHPQQILNRLYKYTELQKPFHLNMLALVNGIHPKVLGLKEVLVEFLNHRQEVVTRRTKFDLAKAKERAHILEGLAKCLGKIDQVITTIKASKNRQEAQLNLIKKFKLTEIQANAVLEIKLQQLAKLEREKIEQELKEKQNLIKELEALLKSQAKIWQVVKKELLELKAKFADQRKTKVVKAKPGEFSEEDLVPEQDTLILLTSKGLIKRVKPEMYRPQKRGGKGVVGAKIEEEDFIEHSVLANTHNTLFFFTDSGKVFQLPVYQIPEGTRTSKGKSLVNFIEILPTDKILTLMPLSKKESEAKYLVMATKKGLIKKTLLQEYQNVRKSGLIALKLKKDDLLVQASKTSGQDEILLITKKGKAIRFKEKDIREMGRTATGIKAIKLKEGDEVLTMRPIPHNIETKNLMLLTISKNGIGKKSKLSQFRVQKRGGSGIKAVKLTKKTGPLAFAQVLTGQEQELIIISEKGQIIKTSLASVRQASRMSQGVKLIKLTPGDSVISATCI